MRPSLQHLRRSWTGTSIAVVILAHFGSQFLASAHPFQAAGAQQVGVARFLETFDGTPERPLPFRSDRWDITVFSAEPFTYRSLRPMHAMHGPDCSPPPAVHAIDAYAEADELEMGTRLSRLLSWCGQPELSAQGVCRASGWKKARNGQSGLSCVIRLRALASLAR